MTMKILERLIRRFNLNNNTEEKLKDKELIKLKREVEYYRNRLAVLEDALNIRVSELETRLARLEETQNRTDHIIKIIESLEPESRRN